MGVVDEEANIVGDHSHIFLGGSSQGCCAAFDVFARYPLRLGGFIGMVGHPLSLTPLQNSSQCGVPCWFFNGAEDNYMQLHWVQPALERLKQAGWRQVKTVLS